MKLHIHMYMKFYLNLKNCIFGFYKFKIYIISSSASKNIFLFKIFDFFEDIDQE